jgi:hypothetical protein
MSGTQENRMFESVQNATAPTGTGSGKRRKIADPSPEELHRIFKYQNGELYRKFYRGGRKPGTKAGSVNSSGYVLVSVNGARHVAHRLIWVMFYGSTTSELDHINGSKIDNRIENLRRATRSENGYNRFAYRGTRSGVKGVQPCGKRWRADIKINKRSIYLGMYNTLEEARRVITSARKLYHGEFCNLGGINEVDN